MRCISQFTRHITWLWNITCTSQKLNSQSLPTTQKTMDTDSMQKWGLLTSCTLLSRRLQSTQLASETFPVHGNNFGQTPFPHTINGWQYDLNSGSPSDSKAERKINLKIKNKKTTGILTMVSCSICIVLLLQAAINALTPCSSQTVHYTYFFWYYTLWTDVTIRMMKMMMKSKMMMMMMMKMMMMTHSNTTLVFLQFAGANFWQDRCPLSPKQQCQITEGNF